MIETIVTNLLTKYLGQYIEGLNNLNISLAQGEAVLKNLALRRSALDDFELPVTVLSGTRPLHCKPPSFLSVTDVSM